MDSDHDLKDLIKEAADMEDAKYEESFSLNLEDQEISNNYQITNGDQEAQEGLVLSQKRQGKPRETPAEQAVITRSSTLKRRSISTGQAGKSKTSRKKSKVDYAQGHGECEVVPIDNQEGPDISASLKSIKGSILALSILALSNFICLISFAIKGSILALSNFILSNFICLTAKARPLQ